MPSKYYRKYAPLTPRICHFCGKEFTPLKSNSEVLCSHRCKIDSINHRQWKNKPILCSGCGVEFLKTHATQRFCSEGCRVVHKTKFPKRNVTPKVEKPLFSKVCNFCGTNFETFNEKQKYCGFTCVRHQGQKKRGNREKSDLAKQPCEVCGFDDLRAIHRHHIDPEKGNAGGVMSLCANHHAIYHAVTGWNGTSEHKTREEVISIVRGGINGKEVPQNAKEGQVI